MLVLRDRSSDLNMRAAVLHMGGDALASLAVVVLAAAILFVEPSATWLDPVSALVVAAIIVCRHQDLVGSVAILLESTPPIWTSPS